MKVISCERDCEFCKPSPSLSRAAWRDLLARTAQRIFDRRLKVGLSCIRVNPARIRTKPSINISTDVLINLLNTIMILDPELEVISLDKKRSSDDQRRKFCNRVAAIISHTYVELGDGANFADDEALLMIRDLLLQLDDTIIKRNSIIRITRKHRSGYGFDVDK